MYEQKNHAIDLTLLTFVVHLVSCREPVSGHSAELTLLKETRADSLSHKSAFQLTKHGGIFTLFPRKVNQIAGAWSYLINFRDLLSEDVMRGQAS